MATPLSEQQDAPNIDGRFRVALDRTECEAFVDRISLPSGSGKPITQKAILEKLKELKVSQGVNLAAIDLLVQQIAEGQLPKDKVIVALGDPPKNGKDGAIEWLVEPSSSPYLLAGQLVARVAPPTNAEPGKNLLGKQMKARAGTPAVIRWSEALQSEKTADAVVVLTTKRTGKLTFAEGQVDVQPLVRIAEDGFSAAMEVPFQWQGSESLPVSVEHLLLALEQSKVQFGIHTEKLVLALKGAVEGRVVQAIPNIADGIRPIDAVAAKVQWLVNPEASNYYQRVVVEDQPVARVQIGASMCPGKNLFGEEVPGKILPKKDIEFGVGVVQRKIEVEGHWLVDCCAQWLGVFEIKEQVATVRPCIQVSENRMEAVIELFVRSGKGTPITSDLILTSLLRMGVCVGVDKKRMDHAVALLGKMASDAGTFEVTGKSAIASGIAPQAAVDERLELDCKMSAGEQHEDGKIDFHERSFTCKFSKGDLVGRILPAQPAVSGSDLYGNAIAGAPAQKLSLTLSNVEQTESGELIAQADGSLVVCGNRIEITDLVMIDKDVCQETGNIHSKGSVQIKEYVQPGFLVESDQNVMVGKNLEGGRIKAGGSVSVAGGVRGHASEISTEIGDIQVGFSEQAKLTSAGSISIATNCINSTLVAKTTIIIGEKAPQKGHLIGGLTRAQGIIRVNVLGAESCVKTLVEIAIPDVAYEQMRLADEKAKGIQQELEKLNALRTQLNKADLTEQQETILGRVVKTKMFLETELEELEESRHNLKENLAKTENYQVIVEKQLYPGVKIRIFGADYKVERESKGCRFQWTREGIKVLPR